jgi:hypothetical protein
VPEVVFCVERLDTTCKAANNVIRLGELFSVLCEKKNIHLYTAISRLKNMSVDTSYSPR